MDAFFASVEIGRHPELVGRPVAVGGTGRRGVVAAASYEARAHGVRSAMPMARARRLCPDLVVLPADHRHYQQVSARIMGLLADVTPLVEPLSLDEAFCDVRGVLRARGPVDRLAVEIRRRIADETGLACSIGVASCKFLAKLATERAKPRPTPAGPAAGSGVHLVAAGGELAFLRPHPVTALWGVGQATARRLGRLGVETVGDLADLPLEVVVPALGRAVGRHLHELANGVDRRPVVVGGEARSIGHEETFAVDLVDADAVDAELVRLADLVAERLRRASRAGRTVTVKARYADFRTITRSRTLPDPVTTAAEIVAVARRLATEIEPGLGVRLLGISVSHLTTGSSRQLRLDLDGRGGDGPAREAAAVVGRIRERFGVEAIGPARGRRRVDPDTRGRWGPDEPESDHAGPLP
ncbi:MAG: DNA polymerase IV [Actinomyces sp.]|nr:MAG: DNA polymerase IV [Actinomyces sp.]